MSAYYSDSDVRRRRRPISVWPFVLLLIVAGIGAYWLIEKRHGGLFFRREAALNAVPRNVVDRGELPADDQATIEIYRRNAPSVVHINNLALRRNGFTRDVFQIPSGSGSGFVWDDSGIIVTNAHVVRGAHKLEVILADDDSTTYETTDCVAYPDKDLAVLYIDAPKHKLHPIPEIGKSSDLKVGQKAFAIGNPFGLDQTLTTGIISALNREIKADTGRPIQGVIQTSAPINPGSSGGPLLDSFGRLIGVNTAIYSPPEVRSGGFVGIGFAIPIDEVNKIVPDLIAELNRVVKEKSGPFEVSPPRMGVSLAPDDWARSHGVKQGALIIEVYPNTPAARVGLQPTRRERSTGRIRIGDIITAIGGEPVNDSADVGRLLDKHRVGDTVTVTIERTGERQEYSVTLAALSKSSLP